MRDLSNLARAYWLKEEFIESRSPIKKLYDSITVHKKHHLYQVSQETSSADDGWVSFRNLMSRDPNYIETKINE